jgi:diguanylate cyclase (GGDEF)-like protein
MLAKSRVRTKTVPLLVLVLGVAAIVATTVLLQRSDAGRQAELKLARVEVELNILQNVPFQASPLTGGSPQVAARRLHTGKRAIRRTLDELRRDSAPSALGLIGNPLRNNYAALDAIYEIGASGREYGRDADRLGAGAQRSQVAVTGLLDQAGREYDARASRARLQATIGSALVILLLVGAFALLYRRALHARSMAEALAGENARLLVASRHEAMTDALTGLRNRRALIDDLNLQLALGGDENRLILALYDLDGFKQYNDTFGHPAGDALLARMGERLHQKAAPVGSAYRMGGDEFCVLVPAGSEAGEKAVQLAADALTEEGEGFAIGCSYGTSYLPVEADSAPDALLLADQRMYENKAGRSSASRQSTDVLVKVLSERIPDVSRHLSGVSGLAERTAERLGLPEHEIKRVALAAELHDIGKTAIPDEIVNKPSALDEPEWEFMRRHTLIGERIVRAAPSLAHTARLVRSSHERFDGSGYPDGLSGTDIPLGASIITVCDAFDAMVAGRPYRSAREPAAALAELRRCTGTQFNPEVVEAFLALAQEAAFPLVTPSDASHDTRAPA